MEEVQIRMKKSEFCQNLEHFHHWRKPVTIRSAACYFYTHQTSDVCAGMCRSYYTDQIEGTDVFEIMAVQKEIGKEFKI